ncbi:MAG: late competence development ComFB family protein [Treponema sp.]|jgi:competence protein ComFB|nr:late competence development ComFB family protein [Treponema sp.]
MKFHNTNEDVVINKVDEIFESIQKQGNPQNFCFSEQHRLDTICYVLNRVEPHYIVSSRGVACFGLETVERQQLKIDITALVYDAIKKIAQNDRSLPDSALGTNLAEDSPMFNIPTILGKLLNGVNFEPMVDVELELCLDGKRTPMIDGRWQNPCKLASQNSGIFSFWPSPVPAEALGVRQVFKFAISAEMEGFETVHHFFDVEAVSEVQCHSAFSMDRSINLHDLYMFPVDKEDDFRV